MTNEMWNDIWKIMKSCELEFIDNSNSDIWCIICKKVLINTHSGPCGCRYCLECITKYLNGEQKKCPGDTNDCKEELLNIQRNVSIDNPMNRKLSKLIVTCPEQNCDFKDELRNIENHMRICYFRLVDCPFVIMGCKDCKLSNTDMKEHMQTEIISHTKLMFEYIENLRNEIKRLKEDKVEMENNNENIIKCMNNFQSKYENDYKEIKEKLKEIENKYDKEQSSINDSKLKYENENREMKEKLKQIENTFTEEQKLINDSKLKYENENNDLKEKLKAIESQLSTEQQESTTKIDEIKKIITDLNTISMENHKSISNITNEMKVLQKNQEECTFGGVFVWRIDKWREKMKEYSIGSEAFYSHINGYKMCLSLYPKGRVSVATWGTYLSIECCVMLGECDDILPWPFKHHVTFELIDQHTKEIHTSSTVTYSNQYETNSGICYMRDNAKPKQINDSNLICYNYKFVLLKELTNNGSLIDNDQIFIRCRVNMSHQ